MSPSAPSRRFRRSEKITLHREVQKIFQSGHRTSEGSFRLIWMDQSLLGANPPGRPPRAARRMALRVSRRAGGAVRRNRIKRLLREVFRHEKVSLRPGTDLVLCVQSPVDAGDLSFEGMRSRWTGLCRKAGCRQEDQP